MLYIQLNNLRFFAFHGLYEEEKLIKNEFEVNIKIDYLPQTIIINELVQTIDYTAVYSIVKDIMETPTPLLETLAMKIVHEIFQKFPLAEKVEAGIKKINPPIEHFQGNVKLYYTASKTDHQSFI